MSTPVQIAIFALKINLASSSDNNSDENSDDSDGDSNMGDHLDVR